MTPVSPIVAVVPSPIVTPGSAPVGATLRTVSVTAAEVVEVNPSCTWTRSCRVSGPLSRPSWPIRVAESTGAAPVASSYCPSASRSQA